jgi:hypothetical protein
MINFLETLFKSFPRGRISLEDYRNFLIDVEKFKFLNDTYINIARLKKPSFFVLHHDVHRDIDKMVQIAKIEHALGWKANYFLRNDPQIMKYPPVRIMLNLKHDVGLLYDMLETCSQDYDLPERELRQRAWFRFQNCLLKHIDFNISAIACYNRPGGRDNREMWKSHDYRGMHIRCDADTDFCDDMIVYFKLQGRHISYQHRDYYGEYHPIKPWLKIRNIKDLGQRLKSGKLSPRIVVRITWK